MYISDITLSERIWLCRQRKKSHLASFRKNHEPPMTIYCTCTDDSTM